MRTTRSLGERDWHAIRGLLPVIIFVCTAHDPAWAQEDADQERQSLEEIVVTAERIERDLQSTPISVLAVPGEVMLEMGVENITELSAFLPNVSVGASSSTSGSNDQQFSIRGVSQIRTGISGDRSVGFYIDDQFFPRTTGSTMRALDIENVEVLRGPQGTLFGRNNTGGAIRFTTRKPDGELGGSVRFGFGNLGRKDVTLIGNVPVSDDIWLRGTIVKYDRDGHVEGTETSETLGNVDDFMYRGAIHWNVTDNFVADLAYTSIDSEENGFPLVFTGDVNHWDLAILGCQIANPTECPRGSDPASDFVQFPASPGGTLPNWVGLPLAAPPGFNTSTAVTDDPYTYVGGDDQFNKTRTKIINGKLNWRISDKFSIRSITSLLSIDTNTKRDADQSPQPILRGFSQEEHDSWSQEFHLVGNGYFDGRLDFQAGAFLFYEENRVEDKDIVYGDVGSNAWSLIDTGLVFGNITLASGEYFPYTRFTIGPTGRPTRLGICPLYFPFGGGDPQNPQPIPGSLELVGCINPSAFGLQTTTDSIRSSADSWAVFGDVSYALTEKLTIGGGLRYSEDDKTWEIIGGTDALGNPVAEKGDTWDDIDWRALLQYDWTEDVMTYFSAAKAYKSGGFTDGIVFGFGGFFGRPRPENLHPITGEVLDSPYIPYDPETVVNYELGIRSEWMNNRLRANLTFFYMDYTDKHIQLFILPGAGGGNTEFANSFGGGPVLINAAKVEIKGLEGEFVYAATRNLILSAMFGYLDGSYEKLDQAITAVNLDTPLERMPEFSYTLGAQYRRNILSGIGSARITYGWTDDQWSGSDEDVQFLIPSVGLLNASVSYRPTNGNWSIRGFVNNMADEEYNTGGRCLECFSGGERTFNTPLIGADLQMPGRSREWGIEISYTFGGG